MQLINVNWEIGQKIKATYKCFFCNNEVTKEGIHNNNFKLMETSDAFIMVLPKAGDCKNNCVNKELAIDGIKQL